MELLREKGMSDVVVVVGGTIPDEDVVHLVEEHGVAKVFQPGASLAEVVEFTRAAVAREEDA
jgi:methylmalonyl-CoA mutase C-terminal domain/subunit